jgi:hypothetical protein
MKLAVTALCRMVHVCILFSDGPGPLSCVCTVSAREAAWQLSGLLPFLLREDMTDETIVADLYRLHRNYEFVDTIKETRVQLGPRRISSHVEGMRLAVRRADL